MAQSEIMIVAGVYVIILNDIELRFFKPHQLKLFRLDIKEWVILGT